MVYFLYYFILSLKTLLLLNYFICLSISFFICSVTKHLFRHNISLRGFSVSEPGFLCVCCVLWPCKPNVKSQSIHSVVQRWWLAQDHRKWPVVAPLPALETARLGSHIQVLAQNFLQLSQALYLDVWASHWTPYVVDLFCQNCQSANNDMETINNYKSSALT